MSNNQHKQFRKRLQELTFTVQQLQTGLAIMGDLLIEKGAFTVAEIQAFVAKKQAEANAPPAPTTVPEDSCLNDSSSTTTPPAV